MLNENEAHTYEITPLTMAIIAKRNENGMLYALVLEEAREYTVFISPTKMVDFACKFYGSSLQGRLDGTRNVCKITHKAPIVIDPATGMYFFPTASPQNKDCSWLAHSHIVSLDPVNKGSKTAVTFKNRKTITLDVSMGSRLNQQYRTAQFRYSLDERMNIIRSAADKSNIDSLLLNNFIF